MDQMLWRVRGEFTEMPGLQLTVAQASRLWGLDAVYCADLLHALVGERFLFQASNGTFMLAAGATPIRSSNAHHSA
jgi:hypothetical protein